MTSFLDALRNAPCALGDPHFAVPPVPREDPYEEPFGDIPGPAGKVSDIQFTMETEK